MRASVYLAIAFLYTHHHVDAYPGAGFSDPVAMAQACVDMMPSHEAPQQTGECPYELTFSKTPTKPGETITITLMGNGASTFRGFMIQGRTSDGQAVGTFTPSTNSKINCDFGEGKSALSHDNGEDKNSITATWTSPDTGVGEVTFLYTLVDVKQTFWVKQEAIMFTINGASRWQTNTSIFLAIISCLWALL